MALLSAMLKGAKTINRWCPSHGYFAPYGHYLTIDDGEEEGERRLIDLRLALPQVKMSQNRIASLQRNRL